jgi:WD40 repeat protein
MVRAIVLPKAVGAGDPGCGLTHAGAVEFCPDCKLLASGGWDKTIKVWDMPATKKADM